MGKQPEPLMRLCIAFNSSTLLFATPLYERIYMNPGTFELLRLIVIVQVAPTMVFFLVGEFVGRGSASQHGLRYYYTGLVLATLFWVWRLVQIRSGLVLAHVALWQQIGMVCLVGSAVLALGVLANHALLRFFGSVAPVFLVVSAYFFISTILFDVAMSRAESAIPLFPGQRRSDSVHILVLDELGRDVLLKNGEIDGEKFPHIKMLAADGTWFSNATTNYDATCPSIPSLFSGRFVTERGLSLEKTCSNFVVADTKLITALGQHYKLSIYQEYFRDCRSSTAYACRGIPYLIATNPHVAIKRYVVTDLVPPTARREMVFDWIDDTFHTFTQALFQDYLTSITQSGARGRAHVVHLMLPHGPYVYDRYGTKHHSPYSDFRGDVEYDAKVYPNYEQQVMLVDRLVGQIVDKLKTEGLYDEATIVITADHGPRAHNAFVGSRYPAEIGGQIANIPLLVRSPRIQPQVVETDYQHVDFAPTVLDMLALESMPGSEGVSALSSRRPVREKRVFSVVDWQTHVLADRVYVMDPKTGRWILESYNGAGDIRGKGYSQLPNRVLPATR